MKPCDPNERSGVFRALHASALLERLSPKVVWHANEPILRNLLLTTQTEPAGTLAGARAMIANRRSACGAIVNARCPGELESAFTELRAGSRRVPILVVGPSDHRMRRVLRGVRGVAFLDNAVDSTVMESTVREFIADCADRAAQIHHQVDSYARLVGLTPAEAELVFRVAMGVRPADLDGRLAHLDGLNLSRAWMLARIAAALPSSDPRRAAYLASSRDHETTALAAIDGAHYAGSHWLGTFACVLITMRPLVPSSST
ncbi:DUF2891 family protein [Sandaracinus amylolyticus]|uniref:DUF2891 family protein n=1 Tax=Sandaracinus amylolyticus TaxID=927083 RepID=UPI001F332233|nr:DUF2891 family protein [Sandaracinus amylolyticus]UJR84878.1 Hypothetical protein I5071_69570 [Sandaracinus amylolyticus]